MVRAGRRPWDHPINLERVIHKAAAAAATGEIPVVAARKMPNARSNSNCGNSSCKEPAWCLRVAAGRVEADRVADRAVAEDAVNNDLFAFRRFRSDLDSRLI